MTTNNIQPNDMELHDDDKPVGRLLSRREMLTYLGGGSVALFAGLSFSPRLLAQITSLQEPTATPLPACVVRPELTEGPYFVDGQLNRWDIRVDPSDNSVKAGLPLLLRYRVSDVTGGVCLPLEGAQVDVWHCDADGEYSGVQDSGFDTSDQMWLRGYQVTDAFGMAEFLTVVPGWYSGRAVHIHFKIRTEIDGGESYEFTSQFFFDPELIEDIYSEAPYAGKGLPDMPNERDSIYQQSDGQLTLELVELSAEQLTTLAENEELVDREDSVPTEGYVAVFDVGLDLSDAAVGASDSAGSGGGAGGPGGRGGGRP